MKNRDEVSLDEAERLCKQLEDEGLQSFGKKKVPGYYERES